MNIISARDFKMSQKVKIAIIGTGWWATTAHIPTLKQNPRAEVILVDPNPAALKAAADRYDVSFAYANLEDRKSTRLNSSHRH